MTTSPRSALADGAAKLAKLARTVREQQIANGADAMRVPLGDVYSMSPDEVWSKRFMSQGIGPVPECAAPGGYCEMPLVRTAVAVSAPPAPEPQAMAYAPRPEQAPKHGQIGQAIGKPYKRSWFRRRSP